jgi:hypothetical protein
MCILTKVLGKEKKVRGRLALRQGIPLHPFSTSNNRHINIPCLLAKSGKSENMFPFSAMLQ